MIPLGDGFDRSPPPRGPGGDATLIRPAIIDRWHRMGFGNASSIPAEEGQEKGWSRYGARDVSSISQEETHA
jgi:hypothetical protein